VSATNGIIAAGVTNPGLRREVNEDRFYIDVARGIFAVIDGVGGQAAGGRAADVAVTMLRTRLERETGPLSERLRESIAIANNEIHRLAATRPEWKGMACVLTVALVADGRAVVGHVGDTRLYKLRHDTIEKITRDHSPVGEREDAHELSEVEAMRHPRRHEVYRDVGSEQHQPSDPEFVEIQSVAFEADEALLLCSDGLSDLVTSTDIRSIVNRYAGDPEAVVRALIAAANAAGGKDNVTAVYVEGEGFARRRVSARSGSGNDGRLRHAALVLAVTLSLLFVPADLRQLPSVATFRQDTVDGAELVRPSQSISAAIARAQPMSQVIVEPGEYREQLNLKDGVRVVSRVPRGATIRLPATASEDRAAVIATGLGSAELVGFRIVGDAATPLGTGLLVRNSSVSIVDVEITGATKTAVDFAAGSNAGLVASDIHDNPGAALVIGSGASPRIAHNTFARNGLTQRGPQPIVIERGAEPRFHNNVFNGMHIEAFGELDDPARRALTRDNWFVGAAHAVRSAAPIHAGERGQ
jgi:serine/threonine protein phosphatase PrpC